MLRVDAAKLDGLLFQTEELLAVKLATGEQVEKLEALQSAVDEWRQRNTQAFEELRHLRESQRKPNKQAQPNGEPTELNKFYEFLDWSEGFTRGIQDRLKVLSHDAEQEHR